MAQKGKSDLGRDAILRVASLPIGITALVHGRKLLGFRAQTWVGVRSGTVAATRAWLAHDQYTVREIASLLTLAPRETVDPNQVQHAITYGFNP